MQRTDLVHWASEHEKTPARQENLLVPDNGTLFESWDVDVHICFGCGLRTRPFGAFTLVMTKSQLLLLYFNKCFEQAKCG